MKSGTRTLLWCIPVVALAGGIGLITLRKSGSREALRAQIAEKVAAQLSLATPLGDIRSSDITVSSLTFAEAAAKTSVSGRIEIRRRPFPGSRLASRTEVLIPQGVYVSTFHCLTLESETTVKNPFGLPLKRPTWTIDEVELTPSRLDMWTFGQDGELVWQEDPIRMPDVIFDGWVDGMRLDAAGMRERNKVLSVLSARCFRREGRFAAAESVLMDTEARAASSSGKWQERAAEELKAARAKRK